MKDKILILFGLMAMLLPSCQTNYNAQYADVEDMAEEGGIVFVRPDRYTVLGTRSIRDYIEITYEKLSTNNAGFPMVEVGIRNRGGQHFWDKKGPEVLLSAKTCFYASPIVGTGPTGPPVYETNWRTIHLNRGATEHFKVVSPEKNAQYYQITFSELQK
jgi:hypothetical protein